MRVKIESDGRTYYTKLVDLDTGEVITDVKAVHWSADVRGSSGKAYLDVLLADGHTYRTEGVPISMEVEINLETPFLATRGRR